MPESLARKLKAARKKLDLTQSEAAEAWGIPFQTLVNWEYQRRTPTGFSLKNITELLDRILEEENSTPPTKTE